MGVAKEEPPVKKVKPSPVGADESGRLGPSSAPAATAEQRVEERRLRMNEPFLSAQTQARPPAVSRQHLSLTHAA